MQKITPFLWFDNNGEEAINFYLSVFNNSKWISSSRWGEQAPPGLAGKMMGATFELDGQTFMVLNAGPMFKFTEAISLYVNCETQAEVDELWNKLTADGGEESMCGWLKDKYGLSWQIIPAALSRLMNDKDAAKAQRVMQAMLGMRKIDIAGLQKAYDGK